MEYHDLLAKADQCDDPVLRLIYVAVFNIALHNCTHRRISKPFNPLLGETFELRTSDYNYISEQVSHHPPISACYAIDHNKTYKFWRNTYVKTSFTGTSVKIIPLGQGSVRLERRNEEYTIHYPPTYVHNIILG